MKKSVQNWFTSTAGVITLALSIYFLLDGYLKGLSLTYVIGFAVFALVISFVLFRAKDPEWIKKISDKGVKKFLSIMIILLLFTTSCITSEKCSKRYPPEIKTITKVETTIQRHDSLIVMPADSSSIKALIECDSLGNAYIKEIESLKQGKKVKSSIIYKDKYIYLDCEVDSSAIAVAWNNKITKIDTNEKEIIQPVIEKESWWVALLLRFRSFFEVSGYILWILVLFFLVKKFGFRV